MIATLTHCRPERIGCQTGDQRRVDPTGETQHDVLEAVLAHVVTQPELPVRRRSQPPRAPAARPAARPRRRWRLFGACGGAGSAGSTRALCCERLAAGRWLDCSGRRRQPRSGSGLQVDVAYEQLLAKLCGARDRHAGMVDHAGVPVEHELVLPADEGAEGHAGEAVAGALGEHALALGALAGVIGGGGDVEDQGGARAAPRRWRAARFPTCPRTRSTRGALSRRRAPLQRARPGSSAARRRRRSWAGTPCGRSRVRTRWQARRRR